MSGTSPEATLDPAGPTEIAPAPEPAAPSVLAAHPNPFRAIALLLKSVADSLENSNAGGRPPRYVRIARLRNFLSPVVPVDEKVPKVIGEGVRYFIMSLGYIQKFSLKAEALLTQGDAGKALFETASNLLDTVADREFFNSLTSVVDGPQMEVSPLNDMRSVVGAARYIVARVPEPEDLAVIGTQLYRMLAVEQLPLPEDGAVGAEETSHIDMARTGELRLMLWALSKPFGPVPSGPVDAEVTSFGMRRLRQAPAGSLSSVSRGSWTSQDGHVETIFECNFAPPGAAIPGIGGADIREMKALLRNLGYLDAEQPVDDRFDANATLALEKFQYVNQLQVTGLLDNPTINGLLNLRYDPDPSKGGIRLATPYSKSAIAGFEPNAKA